MPSDAELLLKYRSERSDGTFKQILERHGPMVLWTCLRRLGNQHDAEDAAQETFAILARRVAEINGSLSGWLHGVAVHTANQIIRTRVRRVRREKQLANMNRRISFAQAEESDWKEEIDAALVELPEDLREAVILRYLEGLKHEEVAGRTGCPVSTTAWRSDQGLQRLRSIMARRGVMLSVGSLAALLLHEAEAMAALSSAALASLTTSAGGGSVSAGATASSLGKVAALVKAPWAIAATTVVLAAGVATSVAVWPTAAKPPAAANAPVYTKPAAVFDSGKKGTRGHNIALNDKLLATGNSDRTIDLWEVSSTRHASSLGGTVDDTAIALAFSPTQNILATAGDAGLVKLWSLETRQEVAALPTQPRPINTNTLAFSADGKLLAAGAWNGAVTVFDVATLRERYTHREGHSDGVMVVRFSRDGKLLASASWDGVVKVWEASSGKPLQTLAAHPGKNWIGLDFSVDGVLASGGLDHHVKIWNWAEGTVQKTLQGHTGPVLCVSWSPDGKVLASGSQDGTVKLWDAQHGALLATYELGDQGLHIQFTSDGKFLVTGGWNPPLKMWQVP
jgi:RNA polymerase sigma factor (sigma-70 family)